MAISACNKGRLFFGTYPSSCDAQRRVTMPKAWRLPTDTEDTQFFLIPGRNQRIHLVTEEQMERFLTDLMGSSVADGDRMESYTDIGAKIQIVTLDRQGRFAISSALAEFAGISDKVVFLGSMINGTIIAQDKWQDCTSPRESSWDMLQKIHESAASKPESR